MDKVVAITCFRDMLVAVTERGKIWAVYYDPVTNQFVMQRQLAEIPLD